MYELKVTSESGESITFSPQNNENFSVISITGLNPVNSNINTSPLGLSPGEEFNGSKSGMRNIVINLVLFNNVEDTRKKLYGIFQTGKEVVMIYKNDLLISGYVESIDCDLFTNQEKMQISIICPYPYFRTTSLFEYSSDNGMLDIYNDGIETGCTISINGTNPVIKNEANGIIQEMELTSTGAIRVDTKSGIKGIMQKGKEIFPFTSKNDWITLKHGNNHITTNTGSISLMFFKEYNGV